jgi:hypothetical protein
VANGEQAAMPISEWIILAFLAAFLYGSAMLLLKILRFCNKQLKVKQAKQDFREWDPERMRWYNNLPDLGKARVDKRQAQIAKYGGTAAYGLIATIVITCSSIAGWWSVPLFLGGRWAVRNWKEQDQGIKEADERREKILGPFANVPRFCTHCGMSTDENDSFCSNCGLAVNASSRPKEAVVDPAKVNDEWAEAVSHWDAPETKHPFGEN